MMCIQSNAPILSGPLSFSKCVHLQSDHNCDTERFHHPQQFPPASFSVSPFPAPTPGKQVCFLSLWFLPFLEFHMGGIMHLALCL